MVLVKERNDHDGTGLAHLCGPLGATMSKKNGGFSVRVTWLDECTWRMAEVQRLET